MHMLGELDCIGGTSRLLLYLVKHSDPKQIRHSFLCMRRGELQTEFEKAGAVVEVVDSSSPLAIIRVALRFGRRSHPNVISTHFTRSLVCGALVARLLKCPWINNEHGPAIPELENHSILGSFGQGLKKRLLRTAGAVICNSHYTAGTVANTYKIEPPLLRVIHLAVERRVDGVGQVHPSRISSDAAADSIDIGHIGGMTSWRQQSTLINAIAVLRKRGKEARLILIGNGPMRDSLETLTTSLQLQESVRFLGYRDDLTDFFRTIDVYVNSAVAEGFGIAVVEAMLEGVPVVLANAGAHPEIVENGRTGLLFAKGNAESMASCILQLMENRDRGAQIGAAGREHATHAFAPRRYAQAYTTEIERLLSKTTPSMVMVAG